MYRNLLLKEISIAYREIYRYLIIFSEENYHISIVGVIFSKEYYLINYTSKKSN